jgi:hypothetical protein
MLTGKIECGLCGYKLVGKSGGSKNGKKRQDFYICNNRQRRHECKAKMIGKDLIERLVMDELEDRILNPIHFPALAAELYHNLNIGAGEAQKEAIYLKAEIAKNQIKINNILGMVEEGTGSKILMERLSQRETEQTVLENRLRDIERKTQSRYTVEMIQAYLEAEYKKLKMENEPNKKALIARYVHKVIIYERDFEVIFTVLHTDGGGGACHIVCRSAYPIPHRQQGGELYGSTDRVCDRLHDLDCFSPSSQA